MAAQDAVDFSNDFLATDNRLPHPQEIWDAAWGAAEEKFTSTNNGSTFASQIADSIEAACFPVDGEFILPRESWLREWCRQLRTCR